MALECLVHRTKVLNYQVGLLHLLLMIHASAFSLLLLGLELFEPLVVVGDLVLQVAVLGGHQHQLLVETSHSGPQLVQSIALCHRPLQDEVGKPAHLIYHV